MGTVELDSVVLNWGSAASTLITVPEPVSGLLPVVGVPLPLFSYGGSSVITTYAVVGILLSVRLRRFAHGG